LCENGWTYGYQSGLRDSSGFLLNKLTHLFIVHSSSRQFSLFAQLTKGDPYFNEFHYHGQFGNIKLNAEQGGGPGQLLIWCHLQTLAWWLDPIFDELVQVDDLSMPSTSSTSHR